MVKFVRFLPSSDSLSGLKDDIFFAASELSPFESNSSTVPKFDEGLTSFHSLTDTQLSKELQKQGSVLYKNVDPNSPTSKITIEDINLIPATQQEAMDEFQRVNELRLHVRDKLSNFVAIKFNGKQILQSNDQAFDVSTVKFAFSKKGDILDVASEFTATQSISPLAFTNYVIGSSTQFASVVEIVDQTKVRVDKLIGFTVGGFFTMTNPRYFIQGAKRPFDTNFETLYNNYPPRDVLLFKIVSINTSTKIIELKETIVSSLLNKETLFTTPEFQSVNIDKDLVLAYPGVPVLYNYSYSSISMSLIEARDSVEAEIPITRIYLPKSKEGTSTTYIGNLNRESLNVIMYDDGSEIFLIKDGEAQPAVSVDYKLLTQRSTEKLTNYGDVEVRIKLASYPAKVQTEGTSTAGSTAIRLNAKIDTIPARLQDSGSSNKVNKRTNQAKASTSQTQIAGEFYFSYQTRLPSGQVIDLNKYGTIKIKDKINIYDPSGNIISTNVVKTVDTQNSLLILERPLNVPLSSRSIIEIPQTPLNSGRKYRITVSAIDKQGVSGYQTFNFTTKSLPQTKGTDGSHWEKIPLAAFPPSLDLSVSDSFANAVASSVANITDSWNDLNTTLMATTQNLQNLSCSVGTLIDGLQTAQNFAKSFAQKNNNTQIYVRQIGLDPLGTVNSQQTFINQVNQILNDTGTNVGQIPRLTAAQIPLDPVAIANSLGSGGTFIESALGGSTSLGGTAGKALDALGISASAGLDFKKLSNDSSFRNGFSTNSVTYKVISIIKKSATLAEASIETNATFPVNSFTITNAKNSHNNGTFDIEKNGMVTFTSLGNYITTLKYKNTLAASELNSTANITVGGSTKVKASELIKIALEQEKLYGTNVNKKTISISELLNILIKHNVIGVNPETLEDDKSIAIERLVRIANNNPQRIGGVVFVGKAPNLPALARKAKVLSNTMEWLKPLTDSISASLVASSKNASGVSYDPSTLDLSKLDSQSNIARKDAEAAREKVKQTGVLDYTPTPLVTNTENPADTNFTAWRHYTPVQLLPSLSFFGVSARSINSGIDSINSGADSRVSSGVGSATSFINNQSSALSGGLNSLIEKSQSGLQSGMNQLEGLTNVIDSVSNNMNELNKDITNGINFLKNLAGTGPISMEGHLIGSKLTLQSNEEYVKAVESSINDVTDPNRPTFGSSPTPSTLDAQNRIRSTTTGSPSVNNTALWFGIVLVVVGKDKKDLGEQLHTLADLLAMNGDAIALPAKPKLTFSGLKI